MNDDDITVEAITGQPAADARLSCASFGLTDIGCKRLHNEDAFLVSGSKGLWAVADGMGGHNAGDLASQTVIAALKDIEIQQLLDDTIKQVEAKLQQSNIALIEKASELESTSIIGTTLAMLIARDQQGIVLWAGDSRVYRLRKENLELISHDHSVVNELIDKGVLDPGQAANHPDANKITRSIGTRDAFELELRHVSILPGDRYLICTDGLTRSVSDTQLNMIASPSVNVTAESACNALINASLDADTSDNVTAIVIDFEELQ